MSIMVRILGDRLSTLLHYKQAVQCAVGCNTEENNGRPWSNCTKVGTLSQQYTTLVIL